MRKLFAVAIVGMLALSGSAMAAPIVSLVGPGTIGPGPTQYQVVLTNDTNLIAATFLVTSTGPVSATAATFSPAPFAPVGVPGIIAAGPPSTVGAYGGLLLVGSVAPGTYTMGTVTYTPTGAGGAVIVAAQRVGVDDWFDAGYNIINPVFQPLNVNVVPIPEPATAAMIGLGLVGLVMAGRRNRA